MSVVSKPPGMIPVSRSARRRWRARAYDRNAAKALSTEVLRRSARRTLTGAFLNSAPREGRNGEVPGFGLFPQWSSGLQRVAVHQATGMVSVRPGVSVEVAESPVEDLDVIDLLQRLSARRVELLDVSAAGFLLADGRGDPRIIAASDEHTRLLELFALRHDQGPCVECCRTGAAWTDIGLTCPDATAGRPHFAARARETGHVSTHAIPLRLCHRVAGALNLFQTTPLRLGDDDIALPQAPALGRPVVISNAGQVLQCCRGASRPAGRSPLAAGPGATRSRRESRPRQPRTALGRHSPRTAPPRCPDARRGLGGSEARQGTVVRGPGNRSSLSRDRVSRQGVPPPGSPTMSPWFSQSQDS